MKDLELRDASLKDTRESERASGCEMLVNPSHNPSCRRDPFMHLDVDYREHQG